MTRSFVRWVVVGVLLVFFLATGFIAGVVVDRQFNGIVANTGDGNASGSNSSLNTGLIQEAYNLIQRNYVDQTTLQNTDLTYGAIGGMVDSLGDTGHSRFMSPEVVAKEHRDLQGEFEGIGALVQQKDGNAVIVAPMDNSPAMKAGLKPGDVILKVDDQDVTGLPLQQVIEKILGPAGTQVKLTISRPETGEVLDFNITRAKIEVQNVTWQMLPGTNIAHVRLVQFSTNVSDDLKKALTEAKQQGAQGIIFDLRNNPGGLLDEAIGVTSQFLGSGDVLQTRDAQGNIQSTPVRRGGVATDIPMVVLINEGSASAAEITAGAIQDYQRAQLVGKTTFGTGTVLNEFKLSDGSALLLAVQEWLTPKGRVIWHQGIKPDVEVDLPLDVNPLIPETERNLTPDQLMQSKDAQLMKALELLQGK